MKHVYDPKVRTGNMRKARDLSKETGYPCRTCLNWITGYNDPWERSSDLNKEVTDILLCLMAVLKQGYKHTYQEISDFTGISKQAVHQIERRALKKLRNTSDLVSEIKKESE
tara:strand:+ start:293 stop:628 length:336 start_codon:yes stop_codon:yes gene_type:complete